MVRMCSPISTMPSARFVKKVTSSHGKGTCVVLSDDALDETRLRDTIDATGYTLLDIQSAPYEKKGGFAGLFHRK